MNKITKIVTPCVIAAGSLQVSTLAGHLLTTLPALGGFAPAALGISLFAIVRLSQFIANKAVFSKGEDLENTPNKRLMHNVIWLSSAMIISAIGGAITAVVTGTAILPAMLSAAILTALVWLITKNVDEALSSIQDVPLSSIESKKKITEEMLTNNEDGSVSYKDIHIHKNEDNEGSTSLVLVALEDLVHGSCSGHYYINHVTGHWEATTEDEKLYKFLTTHPEGHIILMQGDSKTHKIPPFLEKHTNIVRMWVEDTENLNKEAINKILDNKKINKKNELDKLELVNENDRLIIKEK